MEALSGNSFYFDFEVRLMEFLQNALGEKLISFISFFSAFGEELLLILILGFVYWCYDKKFGIYVGTNVMIGIVLNPLVKNIFLRRRPYFDNPGIKCLRPVDTESDIYDIAGQGFSFPSGHSTNSVTSYGSLARYKKNKVIHVLAYVLPLLVGFSRIVVGVHYPTDVLCGWLLGLAIIFIVPKIIKKAGEKNRWIVFLFIFLFCSIGLLYCKTSDYYAGLGLLGGFFVAVEYENKFVKFEETRNPFLCITRVFGGGLIYIVLNSLLKLPFNPDFLTSGTFLAGMVRLVRYGIVTFVCVGAYPYVFRFEKKLFK
ncbi:MAG: phosphatase PAP2 family protein [Butyrivibrio sp.]|nr:phosphatase PAP2 family protein [Butyrivibrio sp.]